MTEELTCRFGHECTSGCGNDFDCPCQADHCCALTEDCEGKEHCDDHYEKMSDKEIKIKELFEIKNDLLGSAFGFDQDLKLLNKLTIKND